MSAGLQCLAFPTGCSQRGAGMGQCPGIGVAGCSGDANGVTAAPRDADPQMRAGSPPHQPNRHQPNTP